MAERLNLTELKLLRDLARGLTPEESAAALRLDARAWASYRGHAVRKLRARSPRHAVALATSAGLIEVVRGVAHVAYLEAFAPKGDRVA